MISQNELRLGNLVYACKGGVVTRVGLLSSGAVMPYEPIPLTEEWLLKFGHSSQAFAAQLRRMVGLEDGIQDALFKFTRPITGAYFWCPPVKDGRVQLSNL